MDRIFTSWLMRQEADWADFAPKTDRVKVTPVGVGAPCRKYVAEFDCGGLVRQSDGAITRAEEFVIGIYFGDDHLRRVEPMQLVWLLSPTNVWHPNIKAPTVCLGHLRPAVGLIEILNQAYSILTYQNVSPGDCLNEEAASWSRAHRDQFPIDRRPLKRRDIRLNIREVPSHEPDSAVAAP